MLLSNSASPYCNLVRSARLTNSDADSVLTDNRLFRSPMKLRRHIKVHAHFLLKHKPLLRFFSMLSIKRFLTIPFILSTLSTLVDAQDGPFAPGPGMRLVLSSDQTAVRSPRDNHSLLLTRATVPHEYHFGWAKYGSHLFALSLCAYRV